MKKEVQKIFRELLYNKIELFANASEKKTPPSGWIKTIRIALGMTLKQLADKMNVSMQSINQLEQREKDGAITINKLKEVASALNMNLVYGFSPKDGKFESMSRKHIVTNETKKTLIKITDDIGIEEEANQDENFFNLFSGKKRRNKNK